jgi:hypothetical protein
VIVGVDSPVTSDGAVAEVEKNKRELSAAAGRRKETHNTAVTMTDCSLIHGLDDGNESADADNSALAALA